MQEREKKKKQMVDGSTLSSGSTNEVGRGASLGMADFLLRWVPQS